MKPNVQSLLKSPHSFVTQRLSAAFSLLLIALLTSSCLDFGAAEIRKLEKEKAELTIQVEKANSELKKAKATLDETQGQLKVSMDKLEMRNEELQKKDKQIALLEESIKKKFLVSESSKVMTAGVTASITTIKGQTATLDNLYYKGDYAYFPCVINEADLDLPFEKIRSWRRIGKPANKQMPVMMTLINNKEIRAVLNVDILVGVSRELGTRVEMPLDSVSEFKFIR